MQKRKSILVWGVVLALLSLISLAQTSAETYYFVSAGEGDEGLAGSVLTTVAARVIAALFLFGSSVLFFMHKEIGRKGMLFASYSGLIYMGYVFYKMYASTSNSVFLLIGFGNLLIIAMFIRWLHSNAIREAVQ